MRINPEQVKKLLGLMATTFELAKEDHPMKVKAQELLNEYEKLSERKQKAILKDVQEWGNMS